ncbi:PREDICTED: uncharacterized protein LOC104512177, partial [Eurypyga helias]|uniref:uncharacterized protein LOC104512177 n=1 Tax=Eurypyga helias TaxID=54383 RepID=UPI000528595E
EEEAKQLVRDAIAAGIYNDLGSGSNIDVCVISKNKLDFLRPYDVANKKGDSASSYRERLQEGVSERWRPGAGNPPCRHSWAARRSMSQGSNWNIHGISSQPAAEASLPARISEAKETCRWLRSITENSATRRRSLLKENTYIQTEVTTGRGKNNLAAAGSRRDASGLPETRPCPHALPGLAAGRHRHTLPFGHPLQKHLEIQSLQI